MLATPLPLARRFAVASRVESDLAPFGARQSYRPLAQAQSLLIYHLPYTTGLGLDCHTDFTTNWTLALCEHIDVVHGFVASISYRHCYPVSMEAIFPYFHYTA